jgi:hypothetical protein
VFTNYGLLLLKILLLYVLRILRRFIEAAFRKRSRTRFELVVLDIVGFLRPAQYINKNPENCVIKVESLLQSPMSCFYRVGSGVAVQCTIVDVRPLNFKLKGFPSASYPGTIILYVLEQYVQPLIDVFLQIFKCLRNIGRRHKCQSDFHANLQIYYHVVLVL